MEKRKLAAKRDRMQKCSPVDFMSVGPDFRHQQVDLKPIDPADTIMTPIIRLSETFWAEKIPSS